MPPEEAVFLYGHLELVTHYRVQRNGQFAASVRERAAGSEDEQIHGTPYELIEGAEAPVEFDVEVVSRSGEEIVLVIDGRRITGQIAVRGDRHLVHVGATSADLTLLPRFPVSGAEAVAGGLVAPMPGKVIKVEVAVGDSVEAGQLLLVLEAMKMEHRVTAPEAGTVEQLRATVGEQVDNGELLVVLKANE